MCWQPSRDKTQVAASLQRLTNGSFENSYLDLIRIDKPSVFNALGHLDAKAFGNRARSKGAGDMSIASELSKLTGRSVEQSFFDLRSPSLSRLGNCGLPSLPGPPPLMR